MPRMISVPRAMSDIEGRKEKMRTKAVGDAGRGEGKSRKVLTPKGRTMVRRVAAATSHRHQCSDDIVRESLVFGRIMIGIDGLAGPLVCMVLT